MAMTTTLPLHEILTKLMLQRRIRTAELARQINISQPTLSRIVAGKSTHPHESSLQPIADFFAISLEQLRGQKPIAWLQPSTTAQNYIKVPLINWNEVKIWADNGEKLEIKEELFTDAIVSERAYALRIKDASMEPQFPKDTILIIDPNRTPKDRSFAVIQLQNHSEAIFRQIIFDGPNCYLKPTSPDFDQFKMSRLGEADHILGILVQARKNYEQ